MTGRVFWPIAIGLISLMAVLMWTSIVEESQTFDEAVHLAAGYSYWKSGDFRLNTEHPPLGKLLCSLPLLFLPLDAHFDSEGWRLPDQTAYSQKFLYENKVDADKLLLYGRSVTIVLTLCLGLVVAWWAREKFGAAAALAALFLFATDANMLAHGRYITTDAPAALFLFLAVIVWLRFLETGKASHMVLAGLATGAAMATKYSAFILPGLLAVLAIFALGRLPARRMAAGWAVTTLIALLVTGVCYGRVSWRALRGRVGPLHTSVWSETEAGRTLQRLGERWNLPAHPVLLGLHAIIEHAEAGHPSYLLGEKSKTGWWYYFPAVFAVKTPTALLVLLAVSVPAGLWRLRRRGIWPPSLPWIGLTIPPLLWFGSAMFSRLNIGVRHILPIYPFLFVLAAAVVIPVLRRRAVLLLLPVALMQTWETWRIQPYYLAFFNSLAGGPEKGPSYVLDSNIDWGQDAKRLGQYVRERGIPHVCIAYFGMAKLEYYGIRAWSIPGAWEADKTESLDCFVAVSVTNLYDVYFDRPTFSWLRRHTPSGHIGHSIYLYDLRKEGGDGGAERR